MGDRIGVLALRRSNAPRNGVVGTADDGKAAGLKLLMASISLCQRQPFVLKYKKGRQIDLAQTDLPNNFMIEAFDVGNDHVPSVDFAPARYASEGLALHIEPHHFGFEMKIAFLFVEQLRLEGTENIKLDTLLECFIKDVKIRITFFSSKGDRQYRHIFAVPRHP